MKVKVVVKKGFGDSFPSGKIQDGSELNLTLNNAKELVKMGFVEYKDAKEAEKKEAEVKKEKSKSKKK
jgi:hypothetical protein